MKAFRIYLEIEIPTEWDSETKTSIARKLENYVTEQMNSHAYPGEYKMNAIKVEEIKK